MAKEIPELIRRSIRNAYLNREGSVAAIAKRFNVSTGTVKRICKGLDVVRDAAAQSSPESLVRNVQAIAGLPLDTDQIMRDAIQKAADAIAGEEVKFKTGEGTLSAVAKMILVYRQYNPLTMEEAADIILAIPNFDPQRFAKILRAKIEQRTAG